MWRMGEILLYRAPAARCHQAAAGSMTAVTRHLTHCPTRDNTPCHLVTHFPTSQTEPRMVGWVEAGLGSFISNSKTQFDAKELIEVIAYIFFLMRLGCG